MKVGIELLSDEHEYVLVAEDKAGELLDDMPHVIVPQCLFDRLAEIQEEYRQIQKDIETLLTLQNIVL